MAVLDRACIGRNTTSQSSSASDKPCIITNLNSAQPFFPSDPTDNIARQLRTVEIFWFVNDASPNSDYIMMCRNQSTGANLLTLRFSTNTSITFNFIDSQANGLTATATITLVGRTGVWWHSVLIPVDADGGKWQAFHGRVGVDIDGNPSTADTWPYPTASNIVTGAAPDARLRGLRDTNTANTFICMGGLISSLTGTAVSQVSGSTTLKGGYAELRLWSDVRPGTGPDSLMDLRDQFIDSAQFPSLIHCFRFNEPNGTDVADFDDVGFKDARFVSAVSPSPVGFPSHPFPPSSGGSQALAATSLLNDAAASVGEAPLLVGRTFARSPAADSIASEGGAALSLAIKLASTPAGADAVASEVPPTLTMNKGLSATSDAVASEVPPALVASRRFTATSDALASQGGAALGRAVALSAVSNANDSVATQVADLDVDTGVGGVERAFSATSDAAATEVPPTLRRDVLLSAMSPAIASESVLLGLARALAVSGEGSGASGSSSATMRAARPLSATADAIASEIAVMGGGQISATIRETERIRVSLIRTEAYLSVLEIWNGALTKLRSRRAQTTSDQSAHVIRLADSWALVRDYLLADVRPVEAKTSVVLSRFQNTGPPATDVNPVGPYLYAYLLPSDLIFPLRINGSEIVEGAIAGPAGAGAGWWEKSTCVNLDVPPLRRTCILTNESEVVLEYIYRVSDDDIDILEPVTKMALTCALAAFVAEHFGLDDRSVESIRQEAKDKMREAARVSGQTGTPQMFQEQSLIWTR